MWSNPNKPVPRSFTVVQAFVKLAEALTTICTLGFVIPGWSLDLGVWRMRRVVARRKIEGIPLLYSAVVDRQH